MVLATNYILQRIAPKRNLLHADTGPSGIAFWAR